MFDGAKIVVSRDQVSSELGSEATILSLKNGLYYGLNPVGARVWSLLQQPRTFSELRDLMVAEYDIDPIRLEADVRELVSQLAENHLVEIYGGPTFQRPDG